MATQHSRQKTTLYGLLFICDIFSRIRKQNLPTKLAISDVVLQGVCQLRSRHLGKYVHATECEIFFDQIVAHLP